MNNNKLTRELKEIIYYIRKYGIDRVHLETDVILSSKDHATEFYTQVHKGFYCAQDRILLLLPKILNERKRLKSNLREARRNREKEKILQLQEAIKQNEYQECVVRKVMDAIVWIIFQFQPSTVRRLYCDNEPIDITDSNIESEVRFIENYKLLSPDGFALISDMTSFVQIGDIITVRYGEGINIHELKEGQVNERICNLLNSLRDNPCPMYLPAKLRNENPKFIEQFSRTLKQMSKDMNALKVIQGGTGKDPATGMDIHIVEGTCEPMCFSGIVSDLGKNCRSKGYAIHEIQQCVFIGVYDVSQFPCEVFDDWIKLLNVKAIVCDLRQTFCNPLAYPIYLHPFSETFITEIISGHKVVKIAISLDDFFAMLENMGCSVRWMGKKETSQILTLPGMIKQVFVMNGQAVEIEKNGAKLIFGTGYLSKLFSHFHTPLSLCQEIIETLEGMNIIS